MKYAKALYSNQFKQSPWLAKYKIYNAYQRTKGKFQFEEPFSQFRKKAFYGKIIEITKKNKL